MIDNFCKYDNFYTLINKEESLYKKFYRKEDIIIDRYVIYERLVIYKDISDNAKPTWIMLGKHSKILPIYGHFIDNQNNFEYVNVTKKDFKPIYNYKKYWTNIDNLLKPIHSPFYRFNDVEDLKSSYYELRKMILAEEKANYEKLPIDEILNGFDYKDYYTYENGRIRSLLTTQDLRIILYGKDLIVNI